MHTYQKFLTVCEEFIFLKFLYSSFSRIEDHKDTIDIRNVFGKVVPVRPFWFSFFMKLGIRGQSLDLRTKVRSMRQSVAYDKWSVNRLVYVPEPQPAISYLNRLWIIYTATFRAMGHFRRWCCCPLTKGGVYGNYTLTSLDRVYPCPPFYIMIVHRISAVYLVALKSENLSMAGTGSYYIRCIEYTLHYTVTSLAAACARVFDRGKPFPIGPKMDLQFYWPA
jgi:hypothetical protein